MCMLSASGSAAAARAGADKRPALQRLSLGTAPQTAKKLPGLSRIRSGEPLCWADVTASSVRGVALKQGVNERGRARKTLKRAPRNLRFKKIACQTRRWR